MRVKKIGLFLAFICIIAISINEIKALTYECDFRAASQCASDPWDNIVMRISNTSNAHGEIWSNNNYDQVICCNFTGSRDCSILPSESKIVGLSDNTNAHAEVPIFSNYPVEVCYEHLGCMNTVSGCNSAYPIEIFSLSSTTNAHISYYDAPGYITNICCKNTAEPPPSGDCEAIGGEICLANQKCDGDLIASADIPPVMCCDGNCITCQTEEEVCDDMGRICGNFSNNCGDIFDCGQCPLGKYCNNEIGLCFDEASCNDPLYASWNKDYALDGETVFLRVYASRMCAGEPVSFDVWEEDGILDSGGDDDPMWQPDPARFNALGLAEGNWSAEYHPDNELGESGLPEYRFKANFTNDSGNIFNIDSGYTNGPAAIQELEVNFIVCDPIMTCSDYNDSDSCSANSCETIKNVLFNTFTGLFGQQCGYSQCASNPTWFDSCACSWNEDDDECEPAYIEKICGGADENFSMGWCNQGNVNTIDCEEGGGLYTSSWDGIMVWADGNGWNQAGCLSYLASIGDNNNAHCVLDDGAWHYDPSGSRDECEGGDNKITLECPSELRLPFFGTYGIIASILVISLVYFILTRKNAKWRV